MIVSQLFKKELVKIGTNLYNRDLSMALSKTDLVAAVSVAMELIQDCARCQNGRCEPDSHLFNPAEFCMPDPATPGPGSSNMSFNDGLSDLLAHHNQDNTQAQDGASSLHICAGCKNLGKPDSSSHGAKACPFKSQFFGQ